MRFDEETIRSLPSDELSDADKRYLLARFFPPKQLNGWQKQLRREWSNLRRWEAFLGEAENCVPANNFRYNYKNLISKAGRRSKPKGNGKRVSDYSNWVYGLYRPRPTRIQLATGKRVERVIASQLAGPPVSDRWELIFQDPLNGSSTFFNISNTKIPLVGIPDLVFREKTSNTILIVERKASNAYLPADGWPNLKAQLWCYGQIDDWRDVKDIVLVGEIWGFNQKSVWVRHCYRWTLRQEAFWRDNQELFNVYCAMLRA